MYLKSASACVFFNMIYKTVCFETDKTYFSYFKTTSQYSLLSKTHEIKVRLHVPSPSSSSSPSKVHSASGDGPVDAQNRFKTHFGHQMVRHHWHSDEL